MPTGWRDDEIARNPHQSIGLRRNGPYPLFCLSATIILNWLLETRVVALVTKVFTKVQIERRQETRHEDFISSLHAHDPTLDFLRMRPRMGFRTPVCSAAGLRNGFSLIEVTVVVAISLIVGTIAIPNMVAVISNARLHAGVTSMSGLLQSSRMAAVKQNRTLTAHFTTEGTATLVGYVKLANDGTGRLDTDMQAEWEAPVIMMTTPSGTGAPTAISTSVLGFTPQTSEPSFNSRGLPCLYASGLCANNGFLYYFKDTSRKGAKGWAALSISPAGRIKKWFWNGNEWTD